MATKKQKDIKTAVIMARYSSDNQHETSIEGQLDVCYKFAKDNNIQIVGEYIDRAVSGTSTKGRKRFMDMIDDSAKGMFDAVIVYKTDRFARNRFDAMFYKKKLQDNGVRVISATQPFTDAPESVIMEGLMEAYDEYYSLELAQKVLRTFALKRRDGQYCGGKPPYGYDITDKKQYIINEKQAETVRQIFNMYIGGMSISQIQHKLNHPALDYDKIRRILSNEKYTGTLHHEEEELKNVIPAIIDEGTFLLAQDRHKVAVRNKTYVKSTDVLALANKVYCYHCQSPLIVSSGTSKNTKRYYYYKCNNAKECHFKPINAEYLEDTIFDNIIYYLSKYSVEIANKTADIVSKELDDNTRKELKAQLKKKEVEAEKTFDVMVAVGVTDRAKEKYKKLEQEIAELKRQLEFANQKEVTPQDILDYMQKLLAIQDTSPDFKHELLLNIVDKVIVSNRVITVYCNNSNNGTNIPENEEFSNSVSGSPYELNYELKVYKTHFTISFPRKIA